MIAASVILFTTMITRAIKDAHIKEMMLMSSTLSVSEEFAAVIIPAAVMTDVLCQ